MISQGYNFRIYVEESDRQNRLEFSANMARCNGLYAVPSLYAVQTEIDSSDATR